MKVEIINNCLFIMLLVVLAYFIQSKFFLSPDVSYLLYASKQILAGAKYGADIFETNPPMILYLYTPAVIIAKQFSISIIIAVRFYIYCMLVISLSFCAVLIKKLINQQDKILRYVLFYTLTFALLFLPTFGFAQREYILMILIIPYLLS